MAAYQKYGAATQQKIVTLYRNGLTQLNEKVAAMWASGTPPTGEVLAALKAEVQILVAQRQVIITQGIKRGSANAYNDILHQAAKIVGVDVQRNTFSDADANALIKKRPKDVPSFKALLKKHNKESVAKSALRAEPALNAAKSVTEAQAALKTVLTIDAGQIIRFTNAEATRVVNNAVNMAFETLADPTTAINKLISVAGVVLVKVWIHDSPAVPREYHRDILHGSLPDEDGYWHQDGDKADGPGGFSDVSLNMGCRCSIEVMTVQEWKDRFGESYLQPWSYLPDE